MSRRRVMLDLFSGSGSASQPFLDKGWQTYRYDLEPQGADGIFIDLREELFVRNLIDTWRNKRIDLIWASPPCQEYSTMNSARNEDWKNGWIPDGTLWRNSIHIIEELQPKHFVIENVAGAQRVWGPAAQHFGPYYLWGVFPKFNVPEKIPPKHIHSKHHKWIKGETTNESRASKAAEIPYVIGYYLERAITLQEVLNG
jgi:hypothetical protein